jgi:hypothetical protein
MGHDRLGDEDGGRSRHRHRLLMLLENVFPPIPSELIMPLGALPRRVVIILPPVDGTGGAL